jgi:uncharacterized membrane protein YhaH (DUF805 family)
MKEYLAVLKKYAVFSGRSARKEYWMFVLFYSIIAYVLSVIDRVLFGNFVGGYYGPLYIVYSLALFLPAIAVSVRRLHDIGKSGWWLLLNLLPFIGWIWLIVLFTFDSEPGKNRYGINPKEVSA